MNYAEFLTSKVKHSSEYGFNVAETELSEILFPFQRQVVGWALRVGRAAIFADCGLGKTFMQLEWARHVVTRGRGKVLILAPLTVGWQTVRMSARMGMALEMSRNGDVTGDITITNYEQLDKFNADDFVGVVCDESSILKRR
jgi:hypothetical protein